MFESDVLIPLMACLGIEEIRLKEIDLYNLNVEDYVLCRHTDWETNEVVYTLKDKKKTSGE